MNNITINLNSKKTEIIFSPCVKALENINLTGKKVCLFATKKAENFTNELINYFEEKNIDVYSYLTSDGEGLKTIEKAVLFTQFLSLNNFSRSDIIINIGGGTITDTGAFVASLYMRGISYINIPTTLLCAVDACIGGKTAVDIDGGKNNWGTFYHPQKVIIDVDLIKSSGDDALKGGISEVVKYGIIDFDFGRRLVELGSFEGIKDNLNEIIYKSLKIKAYYVEKDQFDKNERHALNLGHTVAHAIESESGYTISHGEAVSYGLIKECEISFKNGLLSVDNYDLCTLLFDKFFAVKKEIYPFELLIPHMIKDKKNKNNKIAFALATNSGVVTKYFSTDQVIELFK